MPLSFILILPLLKELIQQIDESPLDGKSFDRETLEQLSKEGVTLVSLLQYLDNLRIAFSLVLTLEKRNFCCVLDNVRVSLVL